MGVSGAGKTTVGKAVAGRLGWEFLDADDYHSPEARKKMSSGTPLDDADRAPWLDRLAAMLRARVEEGANTVLACSALKDTYRKTLAGGRPGDIVFVYLSVPREVLAERQGARRGHFFRPELLDSQLQTLEEPGGAIAVDASGSPEAVVEEVLSAIGRGKAGVETA